MAAPAPTAFRTSFVEDLQRSDPRAFAMRRVFEAVPVIFRGAPDDETPWRIRLADALDVDPCGVYLVGSACSGLSLNPNRNLREFSGESDVDVAIVSSIHFEIAWRHLRTLGTKQYTADPKADVALKDLRRELAFWGVIPTEHILGLLPFGRQWAEALELIRKDPPISGREMSVRLYRDSHALVLYQVRSVELVRDRLLTPLPREG